MDTLQKELQEIRKFIKEQNILGKEILTLEEAALYLGQSKSSIYKLTSAKEIPYYSPGGKKIYFRRSELDQWVFSSKVEFVGEVMEDVESYLSKTNKVRCYDRLY